MDASERRLMTGGSDFRELILSGSYYVDKTSHIRDIVESCQKVILFTRPRKFGKSLLLSTLDAFLRIDPEDPGNAGHAARFFDETEIVEDAEFCKRNMGQWPVVRISLKAIGGRDFSGAHSKLTSLMAEVACEFRFLLDSPKIHELMKERLRDLISQKPVPPLQAFMRTDGSLRLIVDSLAKHFERKVILLVDDYDAPLVNAAHNGYYARMRDALNGLFGQVKDHPMLRRAVFSGKLNLVVEDIYAGLGDFRAFSEIYGSVFGFTESEVKEMLSDLGLEKYKGEVARRYKGYRFGKTDIFNPWDVLMFCKEATSGEPDGLDGHWIDTGNNEIAEFLRNTSAYGLECIRKLLSGERVSCEIDEYISISNPGKHRKDVLFMSLLLMNGYLTKVKAAKSSNGMMLLRIPNLEIREYLSREISNLTGQPGGQ